MNLKCLTIYSLIILFNFSPLQAQSAKVLLQNSKGNIVTIGTIHKHNVGHLKKEYV